MMVEDQKIKVVGYTRRSQDDKNKRNMSIQNQDELIMDYALSKGYDFREDPGAVRDDDGYLAQSFNDGYVSSSKPNRNALKRMINFVEDKRIDIILIKDLSRFGRILASTDVLCKKLQKRHIKVWSINEGFDVTENASMRGIILTMNERHLIEGSAAQRRMMVNKRNNKEMFGRPPFGYAVKHKKDVRDKDISCGWIIVGEEAEIIRKLFDDFNKGRSYIKLAEELHKDRKTVKMWLKNKAYCGYFTYHKYEYDPVEIVDGVEVKKLIEEKEYTYKIDKSMLEEPIIELEVWEKVQARFDILRLKQKSKIKPKVNLEDNKVYDE